MQLWNRRMNIIMRTGAVVPTVSRKSKAQKQSSSADAKKHAALDHAAAVAAATAALPMLAPFVSRMLREKLASAQLHSDGSAHVRSSQRPKLHCTIAERMLSV